MPHSKQRGNGFFSLKSMGGMISNEEPRCISFDNTFEDNSVIQYIPKSFEEEFHDIVTLEEKETIDQKKHFNSITLPDEDQNYWTQRVEGLKNEHQQINKIMQSEYENTMENTQKIYPPKSTQEKLTKIKPCLDWAVKISKCYEDNCYRPLVCSPIVQEFVSCVASCTNDDQK